MCTKLQSALLVLKDRDLRLLTDGAISNRGSLAADIQHGAYWTRMYPVPPDLPLHISLCAPP